LAVSVFSLTALCAAIHAHAENAHHHAIGR